MEAAASKSVQRRETLELSSKIAPPAALGSPVAFAGSSSAAASQPWAVALGAPLRARYLASSRGSFGTKWYSGVATAVHADGSVDVAYDDGDAELRVQPKFIKAPAAQPPVAQAPVAPPAANPGASTATPSSTAAALGKRKVVPTMVQIGNQWVKRQNMYDMESGERSVFDSEFDGTRDAAFAPRDRPVYDAARAAAAPKAAPKKPARPPSDAEVRRKENNEALRAEAVVLAARRARFFDEHRGAIAPFVSGSVISATAAAAAAAAALPAKRPLLSQPEAVSGGELRDYQLVGLDWMVDQIDRRGLSPILGDEMGLGKTLQTIAVIAHLKFGLKQPGASLVVCPLSVLSTWCAELKRWCPSLRTIKLHSSDVAERERLKTQIGETIGEYDVVVTTYEMVSPAPAVAPASVTAAPEPAALATSIAEPAPIRDHSLQVKAAALRSTLVQKVRRAVFGPLSRGGLHDLSSSVRVGALAAAGARRGARPQERRDGDRADRAQDVRSEPLRAADARVARGTVGRAAATVEAAGVGLRAGAAWGAARAAAPVTVVAAAWGACFSPQPPRTCASQLTGRPAPPPCRHFVSALLLTGTPLQNNLTELWALLNLLYPDTFPEAAVFDEGFNLGQGTDNAEARNRL